MKQRLRAELVALFGRDAVDKAKAGRVVMDTLTAQGVHKASSALLSLEGQPIRQRELVATYPEPLKTALIQWVLQA